MNQPGELAHWPDELTDEQTRRPRAMGELMRMARLVRSVCVALTLLVASLGLPSAWLAEAGVASLLGPAVAAAEEGAEEEAEEEPEEEGAEEGAEEGSEEGAEEVPEPCAVGSYLAGESCLPIPLGSGGTGGAADGTGSTGIKACEPGTFRSDAATTSCLPIPLGSGGTDGAADGTGSTGIKACVPGTFRGDAEAATTSCLPAPAGSFAAGSGRQAAVLCPAGSFQKDPGKDSCDEAPAGHFVPVAGSDRTALCPRGSFSVAKGAEACTPASIGYYVPGPGASEQLRCITALEEGLSVCPAPTVAPAVPGTDGPATGDEPLRPQGDECPPGTWSPTGTAGAGSSCTPASPGAFVAGAGATAEEQCSPGTYSDSFGATACLPAPVGTFVAGSGAMDPVLCPGALEPGLTSCPDELAAAPEPAETTSGATPWWWWAGGLALVLAAGGGAGAFLLLRRRAGSFAGTEGMAGPSSAPPASPVEVLEWDEALDGGLDGALDDEPQPPSAPL